MKKVIATFVLSSLTFLAQAESLWVTDVVIIDATVGYHNSGYRITLTLDKMPLITNCAGSRDEYKVSHWYSSSTADFGMGEVDRLLSSVLYAHSNKSKVDLYVNSTLCSSSAPGLFFNGIKIK